MTRRDQRAVPPKKTTERPVAFVSLAAAMATALIAAPGTVLAVSFELGPLSGSAQNLFTAGAAWRVQDRAHHLIGKSNLTPGLCVTRDADGTLGGGLIGPDASCSTSNAPENAAYVAAPGSFNPNGDNGNLNYDRGDVVAAAIKLTSEISWSIDLPILDQISFFANPYFFFDADAVGFDEFHPDATLQPRRTPRSAAVEDASGTRLDINGFHATVYLPFIGDRELLLRVGDQGVNWGESTALALNSLNAINPPDATRLRLPGFQLDELFSAVGMVYASTDITPTLFAEAFYQYEWQPAVADPVGTFFSVSDTLGAGGQYAMLSFGKQPEDPERLYSPSANNDDPLTITASGNTINDPPEWASRTIPRLADREPDDDGQYGLALKYFADWLNNGTEIGVYFANYHARIPSVSGLAASPTCIAPTSTTPAEALVDCGIVPNLSGATQDVIDALAGLPIPQVNGEALSPGQALEEIVPAASAALFVDYPEDIRMYGASFNTTVGDLAVSGEYSFRENLPVQVHATDLVYALQQPAFPVNTIALPGVGNVPSRRAGVADFVETIYRNNPVDPDGRMNGVENYIVRGWEPQPVHQLQFTFINVFGGGNWFDANQITAVLEVGGTYFPDLPDLSRLQFQGAETNTHITVGADGTTNGIDSQDGLPAGDLCTGDNTCRQNPTAQPLDHFPTRFSWGLRAIALGTYKNALFGVNLDPLLGVFYDVNGIAPGLGQNFSEGNTQILTGLRFDYLNRWIGEVRLTTFTGGSDHNSRVDRDNVMAYVGYNF